MSGRDPQLTRGWSSSRAAVFNSSYVRRPSSSIRRCLIEAIGTGRIRQFIIVTAARRSPLHWDHCEPVRPATGIELSIRRSTWQQRRDVDAAPARSQRGGLEISAFPCEPPTVWPGVPASTGDRVSPRESWPWFPRGQSAFLRLLVQPGRAPLPDEREVFGLSFVGPCRSGGGDALGDVFHISHGSSQAPTV